MKKKSFLEMAIFGRLRDTELGEPKREYRFHPVRKWKFDFAYPERMVAVEAEGGVFSGGRHTRGMGFVNDCEKYNMAVLMGWKVLRYTSKDISRVSQDINTLAGGK